MIKDDVGKELLVFDREEGGVAALVVVALALREGGG